MKNRSSGWPRSPRLFLLLLAVAALGLAQSVHTRGPRSPVVDEMAIALPLVAQLALASGDRYLAANIGAFRAAVVGTHRLKPETYRVLAKVQADAAFFNPAHEDNYYFAQAILPWFGLIDETQSILRAAINSRPRDEFPPFFYGFNKMHFQSDPVGGAKALEVAAERSTANRDLLTNIAAAWYARGSDPMFAVGVIRALAERAKSPGLKQHLTERALRLERLQVLQKAVRMFRDKHGAWPTSLNELVDKAILPSLPVDPWDKGFELRQNGVVVLLGKES